MFGLVKKLFGKKAPGTRTPEPPIKPIHKTPAVSSPPGPVTARTATPAVPASKFTPASRPAPASAPAKSSAATEGVKVSLLGIVGLLPTDLKPARAVGDAAGVQLSFPASQLLEQLSEGCVRVPFGQIRKLAPPEFFTAGPELDQKLVELPLQEVLPQLQPKSFGRRGNQKAVNIPEDVTNVFSARAAAGAGKAGSAGTSLLSRTTQPPAPAANSGTGATGMRSRTTLNARGGTTPVATPSSPSAKLADPATSSPQPLSSLPSIKAPTLRPTTAQAAAPAAAPVHAPSKPIAAPKLAAALKPSAASSASTTTKSRGAAPKPAPAPVAPPPASDPSEVIILRISQVSSDWPQSIQNEIAEWGFQDANLVLPADDVGNGLRQGRVGFSWAQLLNFLQDGVGADKSPAEGDMPLDLPLSVLAPAFLSLPRCAPAGTRAVVDQTIPDLFQTGGAAEAPAPAPVAPAAPAPAAPAKHTARISGARTGTKSAATGSSGGIPAPQLATPPPRSPAPAPAERPPPPSGSMSVPLAMVDESWFEALKSDIARCQISGLKLELPVEEVDRSLKVGKIEYTWRQVRAWVVPPLPEETGAEHDEKLLTLPLKVIAPLFLGQFKPGRDHKGSEFGSDIPDLFTGGAAPPAVGSDTPGAEASASAATGSGGGDATRAIASDVAGGGGSFSTTQFFRKPPTDLGELFGQPGKRNWTPNEIVQNTTRIRGVAGALIAMQDGLLVAAQLPSSWKPDATAAFLPQIYSRLTQYLRELNVGDMTSTMMTTPTGSLWVFNAGIIYFAVLGKPDETVPLAPIKLIVGELSRHTK